MDLPAVASLHVYPIKGAAGFSATTWTVGERGLTHDRRFMVVGGDGVFLTQRTCPRLALVGTAIEGGELVVSCGGSSIRVPTDSCELPTEPAEVWGTVLPATRPSPAADRLLSDFLGTPCRLAHMPDTTERWTPLERGEPRRRVGFADSAPILVVAETALHELNERLVARGFGAVPMARFRPNIVVRGNRRGDDDRWRSLDVGDVRLRLTTHCKRCKVVTIDQESGTPTGPEPLATLKTYRREGDAVVFGRHALVDAEGRIAVGDRLVAS